MSDRKRKRQGRRRARYLEYTLREGEPLADGALYYLPSGRGTHDQGEIIAESKERYEWARIAFEAWKRREGRQLDKQLDRQYMRIMQEAARRHFGLARTVPLFPPSVVADPEAYLRQHSRNMTPPSEPGSAEADS